MTDDKTLRIERTFQAPAEAVFEALTSEEVVRRWWRAEHGWETSEAEGLFDSLEHTLEAARR